MNRSVRFLPEALDDLIESQRWYAVVAHQLEADAAATGQAELLTQGLGDGDLALAGD